MSWWPKEFSDKKGTFNPHDASTVKHTRLGVWDLYEEREPTLQNIPGSVKFEKYLDLVESLPYVWRMIRDVLCIPTCAVLLAGYVATEIGQAILPALGLWYQGQLLHIMQIAITTGTVDKSQLYCISMGRIVCSFGESGLFMLACHIKPPLTDNIQRLYSTHLFHARARLDVPTYETTSVQRHLNDAEESYNGSAVAWDTLEKMASITRAGVQIVAQVAVLVRVLRKQQDGILLALLSLFSQVIRWANVMHAWDVARVWAATTTNKDFIKMEGWKRVIGDASHRKELVAGNLGEYATSEFMKALAKVGDRAGNFYRLRWDKQFLKRYGSLSSLIEDPLTHLPQILFTIRAVEHPTTMPFTLASLNLVQRATDTFMSSLRDLFGSTENATDQLASMRKMYEVTNIENKIKDGIGSFPEDGKKLQTGVALEFKNVSFKYPGTEKHCLRNVSFSLSPGQLCVIVGANGSGKSTILKLIVRLYDPDEGQILLGGSDIRTLKLYDLRQAISVLFQDYTLFPLSIRDNIAVGDPSCDATDDTHVRRAARLGGAEELIDKLPEGFDTYLERPVQDYYGGLPEGTTTLFGRSVDYGAVQNAGGMKASGSVTLSGGQMQRIAVARTFMRSVVSEDSAVGLLLFDEPSAALDPVAEHDLFDRLRALRGNKTMLFSSHRFGNLTRHADLILYMNESVVVESGTHGSLLEKGGDYAKIWNLQAQAFL